MQETLSSEKEVKDFEGMSEAYLNATMKNWKGVMDYYKENKQSLLHPLSQDGTTIFHLAVHSKGGGHLLHFLLQLLNSYTEQRRALSTCNTYGNTPLHEVVVSGNLEAAKLILEYNYPKELALDGDDHEILLHIRNNTDETPFYRAAMFGQTNIVELFNREIDSVDLHYHFIKHGRTSILHEAVFRQHFETAIWLLNKDKKLAEEEDDTGQTTLQLLAKMSSSFVRVPYNNLWKEFVYQCMPIPPEINKYMVVVDYSQTMLLEVIRRTYAALWKFLAYVWSGNKKIWEKKKMFLLAGCFAEMLIKADNTWKSMKTSKSIDEDLETKKDENKGGTELPPTSPLLMASSKGIHKIVDEMLKVYPQAIEHITEDRQNILHIAIKYRQYKILNLVKKKRLAMDKLALMIDSKGNSILHHAAGTRSQREAIQPLGPVLGLHTEWFWMERVLRQTPDYYTTLQNNDNKTAMILFEEYHAKLHSEAKEWIKGTAESCSTVAILIAGAVFGAVFNVPGGNDDDTGGYPHFLGKPYFTFFIVMDCISVATSLISLGLFLSILCSSFELKEFQHSLPRKMVMGFLLLFMSLSTALLTYSAVLLLMFSQLQKPITSIVIFILAFSPPLLLAYAQLPLNVAIKNGFKYAWKKIKKGMPFRKMLKTERIILIKEGGSFRSL